MLDETAINSRLRQMNVEADPEIIWDETCEGSARALVLFVGPSPGGEKPVERRPMNKNCVHALWNKSFDKPFADPSSWWSAGFRVSWKPLVEAIFTAPYDIAGKLIGRANMDWVGNPESEDVATQYMIEGAPSVLKMIEDCSPELVLPMDAHTFGVLKTALNDGFSITDCNANNFTIRISDAAEKRFHRHLYAVRAESPTGRSFLVLKLPQHPARILQRDYARRCGEAVREAARQISAGQPVAVTMV